MSLFVYTFFWNTSLMQINADHLRIENNEKQLPDSKVVDWDMQLAVQLLDEEVKRRDIDTVSFPYCLYNLSFETQI